MLKRVEVRVVGHVQGVGFRFTTCEVARGFALSGFVRNEPDGSVVFSAEGEEEVVLKFLGAMRVCRVWRFVTGESVSWGVARGERADFGISYV